MDRLHVSDQERHFASPLLYDSRASSGRDRRRRGLPGARSVTAHDSWVFGEWCAGPMRARVFEGDGRDAVSIYAAQLPLASTTR